MTTPSALNFCYKRILPQSVWACLLID